MNKIRDKKLLKSFGERLRTLRKERGLTQEDIAFGADVELSQVYRIEKGVINPTLTTLNAIAKALEIPLTNLFGDTPS